MTGQKLAGAVESHTGASELLDVELEDVMHSLPHLEADCPADVLNRLGEATGIIEEDLVGADLNQQRRQAIHDTEQR